MTLSHLPEPWRPDAIYKLGDRMTLRDEHNVFVLRCEKAGRSGLRPPKMPANAAFIAEHQQWPEIVKIYDAQCEWWLERVVCKSFAS